MRGGNSVRVVPPSLSDSPHCGVILTKKEQFNPIGEGCIMGRKRKIRRSGFLVCVCGYALVATAGLWIIRDRVDEAIVSLVLLGLFPVVMAAWVRDAICRGEIWRQGSRSLTESATLNERRITRQDHPVSFWLMVGLTVVFALAILLFTLTGIYIRWHMAPSP